MTELEKYIQAYFGIEKKDLAVIGNLFHPAILKKGEYYTRTGKVCDKLSFIRSGLVRIYEFQGEKEITQWISSPGYFVTDLSSLLFHTPARRHIQALTDVELFTINADAYRKIADLVPQWHELEKLFIGKCFTILEDRIFSQLSLSAEERYKQFFDSNKELFNEVPLQYLASMLGMTPETFSRIRRKMIS